jgi:acetyltransferase
VGPGAEVAGDAFVFELDSTAAQFELVVTDAYGERLRQTLDVVSPAVPVSLAGVGGAGDISLTWAHNAETDLLGYLSRDPDTQVIAFYVEGFGRNEGRRFVELAAAISKPVVVLKAGKTAEGIRAVSSHTASLAGDYKVFSDVLAQHGIAEARNEFELTCFCESLSHYPRGIEGRVGVITVSGGHGALVSDILSDLGLRLPRLSEGVQAEMRAGLSPSIREIASLVNPVDLTGSSTDEDFEAAVGALGRSPEVDCLLLLLLPY